MKNLWTVLPPLLSDNNGLIEAVRQSDGYAIVDDSGEFRPGGSHGGGHGAGRGHKDKHKGNHGGAGGGHKPPPGVGKVSKTRTKVSCATAQDVTTGTRELLLNIYQDLRERFDPSFVLFSAGPCGAMIGTDLKELAETVVREFGTPAAAVELTGQKPYDVGISKTIEAMAQLMVEPAQQVAGTINILGANELDWAPADVGAVKDWVTQQGFQVLAQPGAQVTAAQLKTMGSAQVNLVVTVSGLAAARYLQAQFGTPYVVAAPFGLQQCQSIAQLLETGSQPECAEPAETDTLIIGEQMVANAVRCALESRGAAKGADVGTFFQLDKAYARTGDRKIKGEDAVRELLNSGKYRRIVADPILRQLVQCDCEWIDLPHKVMSGYIASSNIPLFGSELDNWLEQQL